MKNNNIYTVIFVAVLCTVCAGLMALVNNGLGADILANREYARIRAAVQALDLLAGTTHATSEAQRDATKEAYKTLKPGKLGSLDVLRRADGAFVVEVSAVLRNGLMRAYMAFADETGKQCLGFRVFAHQETGGLGAKIATDEEWIRQFSGLQLHDESGKPKFAIVKARTGKPYEIDAIASASQTMRALGDALSLKIKEVAMGGKDLSQLVKLVFYKYIMDNHDNATKRDEKTKIDECLPGGKPNDWTLDGMTKATVAYPDNIKAEQWAHIRDAKFKRDAFWVNKGVVNVAKGKLVTANKVVFGEITTVTDGDINCVATDFVFKLTGEDAEGEEEDVTPAVTVDLGKDYEVEGICVWHNYKRPIIFENIVVQISTDKNFPEDKTTTIFNNDYEDMIGFGEGKNKLFPASVWGELIRVGKEGSGQKARYVRVYTEGVLNDFSSMPAFLEVGVYARPE